MYFILKNTNRDMTCGNTMLPLGCSHVYSLDCVHWNNNYFFVTYIMLQYDALSQYKKGLVLPRILIQAVLGARGCLCHTEETGFSVSSDTGKT